MKRKIFKALAAVAALAFSSCSMFDSIEQKEENPNPNATYIKINLENSSRTALPVISEPAEFTSFTLTGTTQTANALSVPETTWTIDSTGTAYTKMAAASIAVTAGADYTFTLKAAKGGAVWQGSCTKTIETGTNSLSFTLSLSSLSKDGTGSLSVTLTVPDAVKAVEAELRHLEEIGSVTQPQDVALTFADGKATYTAGGIASGNYVLIYTLYGNTAKTLRLGEWREYAGIADGLTSSSSPVIAGNDDLANIYTITLDTNGGTLSGSFPGSYTRFSDEITLPVADKITKGGYKFVGWKNAQGETVTKIEKGSTGSLTLTAQWTAISGIYTENDTYFIGLDLNEAPADGNGAW